MHERRSERNRARDGTPSWEPYLRRVVADALGLESPDGLLCGALADDFAVDSLDLLEVAGTIEERLGVAVPETAVQRVRSYADLVAVVADGVGATGGGLGRETFTACCTPPPQRTGVVLQAGALAPYDLEILEEACLALGAGSRLEIAVRSPRRGTCGWVRERLARLPDAGVEVVLSTR